MYSNDLQSGAQLMFGSLTPQDWLMMSAPLVCVLLVIVIRFAWARHLDWLAVSRGIGSFDYVRQMPGGEFEAFCAAYFRDLGYRVQQTRTSGDHGVDLVLTAQDERLLVQCKRHARPVGEPVIRDLYGALLHDGATGGVVCASEGFTGPARAWARGKPIMLLSGQDIWRELVRSRG